MRFGNTHGVPVIGGSFILEVSSYSSPINDAGWGLLWPSASNRSTNPYQTTNSPANQSNLLIKSLNLFCDLLEFLTINTLSCSAYLRINIYLQLRQEDTDYLFMIHLMLEPRLLLPLT